MSNVCDALELARSRIDQLLEQMSDGNDPSAFDLMQIESAASALSEAIRPVVSDDVADPFFAERERPIMLGRRGAGIL